MEKQIQQAPLAFPAAPNGILKKTMYNLAVPPLKAMVRLKTLNRKYAHVRSLTESNGPITPVSFLDAVLSELNVGFDLSPQDLTRIPEKGPLVVVANHPYGALEGMILMAALLRRRPDVKVLANFFLSAIEELRPLLVSVDPFNRKGTISRNISSMRSAKQWLADGGMLVVFPAGEVSSVDFKTRSIADPIWNIQVAKLIRKSEAEVLPVYFDGTNSPVFHLAGMVHKGLRTILLPGEMLNKKGRMIRMEIGSVIPRSKIQTFEQDAPLLSYLRLRTYNLRLRRLEPSPDIFTKSPSLAPQAESLQLDAFREIQALVPTQRLLTEQNFSVFIVRAHEIPKLMRQIGYFREEAFRAVGEGTGMEVDLDGFDNHYLHLLLWDEEKSQLAGAYRLGQIDSILSQFGKNGLYCSTLFHFKSPFFENIGAGLELGRSFIRPEYQKSYNALLMLWKGIGAYVARNPRYTTLLGPVSISDRYLDASKRYILRYLKQHCMAQELAPWVKGKTPPLKKWTQGRLNPSAMPLPSLEDVAALIRDIDPCFKDVPVLLKHYLKLGGKIAAFNRDQAFSNSLDALILVDIPSIESRALSRFMGSTAAELYLRRHAPQQHEAA